jgi:hypothetical protein
LWHQRLSHPGRDAMSSLQRLAFIKCNKVCCPTVCAVCQLGKHVRLPFSLSTSRSSSMFDLIHCDLWTSYFGFWSSPPALDLDCSDSLF